MNITLIGMSGAGKSYVGKQLAERLSLSFFDVDGAMEAAYQKPLQIILDELGEERFLSEQASLLMELTKESELIISTGGSVVYTPQAMEHLASISKILFLDVPCSVIESRIEVGSRGIVGLQDKSFEELFTERRPFYQRWADVTITGEESVEHLVTLLAE